MTAVLVTGTSVVDALATLGFLPGGQPVPLYVVDNTIVDSDGNAAARAFSTLKGAVAHGEAAGEEVISITLVQNNTAHVWDGADSGYVVDSSMSVAIHGSAEELSGGFLSLELTGTFPAANSPAFPRLAFVGLTVVQTGNVVTGQNRQLSTSNVYWYGNLGGVNATCTVDFADCYFLKSFFVGTTFQGPIAGYFGITLQNVTTFSASFLRVAYADWYIGAVRNNSGGISVITADAGVPITINLVNVSVRVNDTLGTDNYITIDSGAGGVYSATGVDFTRRTAASTVKLFNTAATATAPLGITSFVAGQIIPEYTVNSNVVDSIENAVKLTFSAINLAVAHAEAQGYSYMQITVQPVQESFDAYEWDGAASGYAALSDLSVTIIVPSGNAFYRALDIHGVFPDADPAALPNITLQGAAVFQSADLTLGDHRQLILSERTEWFGAHHIVNVNHCDGFIYDSHVAQTQFVTPIGGFSTWTLTNFYGDNNALDTGAMFQRTSSISWNGGVWRGVGGGAGVNTPDVGLTASVGVRNVSIDIQDPTNVGAYAVFDTGVGGSFSAKGVDFSVNGATSAVTLFNATATPSTPVGVTNFPAKSTQNGVAPATTVLVTVPLDVRVRHVYGDVTLTPAAGLPASWLIEVETGIGTGIYNPIQNPTAPATGLAGQVQNYSFDCAGGRRYRFTKSGNAGTTETISHYSYTD